MHKHSLRQAGYTLVELAIVIAAAGMIMASAAAAWHIYSRNQSYQATADNMDAVVNALDDYLSRIGRYPCPARLDLPRTDPAYGMEGQCDPTQTAAVNPANPYPALAAGACANGICEEVSPRVDIQPLVRRGMLPFRILNLPEDMAYDGYHSRLQYAVTEPLTVAATYNNTSGGIAINDGLGNQTSGARYVIVSSGPDRKGAYNNTGQPVLPCSAAASDADRENCNTAADARAIYLAGQQSDGTTHYDDFLRFYSSTNVPLWKAGASDKNVTDMLNAGAATSGVFGIGLQAQKYTMQVGGSVQASGNLQAGRLCNDGRADQNGSYCFTPAKIGGSDPAMKCGLDPVTHQQTYVDQIHGGTTLGQVTCTLYPSPTSCKPGFFIKGINADGTADCESAYPACPAKVVTTNKLPCGVGPAFTIPASDDSSATGLYHQANDPNTVWYDIAAVMQPPNTPGSYTLTYSYACVGGAWKKQYDNGGSCGIQQCLPVAPGDTSLDQQIACTDYIGGGVAGTATGGPIIRHFTDTCEDDYVDSPNTCVCAGPVTKTTHPSCGGAGFSGTRTQQTTWTCAPNGTGSWSDPVDTVNTCKCVAQAANTQTIDCQSDSHFGPGYTGSVTQKQSWVCSDATDGSWSDWTDTSNTCVCTPTTQTQHVQCPTGSTDTSGNGSGITQQQQLTCTPGPTLGPWTQIASSCTACSDGDASSVQTQVVGCQSDPSFGPGNVGNVIQTKHYHCATGKWDASDASNTCVQGSHSWVTGGSASSASLVNPGYPMAGDACTSGASGYCEKLQSGGYVYYTNCHCN